MSYDVAFGFAIVIFIFAYLAVNLDRKHGPIRLLFLFVTLGLTIIQIDILRQVAVNDALTGIAAVLTSGYSVIIYTFIIALLYFLLMFIKNVLEGMMPGKKPR